MVRNTALAPVSNGFSFSENAAHAGARTGTGHNDARLRPKTKASPKATTQ